MLIGFVLLISSGLPMPVSDRIWETKQACESIKERILQRRPMAQLECSHVYR